jgi:hypothetical protein
METIWQKFEVDFLYGLIRFSLVKIVTLQNGRINNRYGYFHQKD